MVIGCACKHCSHNSCVIASRGSSLLFWPRPSFPPVNAACVTTDIIFVHQRRSGEVDTGAFQDNHTAAEIASANESEGRTSASECGPAGELVLLQKAPPPPSALSGWVATGTGSAQVTSRSFVFLPSRLPPRALIGLRAEERPRSADQVT